MWCHRWNRPSLLGGLVAGLVAALGGLIVRFVTAPGRLIAGFVTVPRPRDRGWPWRRPSLETALRGKPRPPSLGRRLRLAIFGATVAGAAFAISGGTVLSLKWMETPEFCGMCHTMKPELLAYEQSPHRSVECAECHIGRGFSDLVRAKLQGSIQMYHLVTGSYPRPIPPAAEEMKEGAESCQKCHREPQSSRDLLVMRNHFREDETNTPQAVALVVRLANTAPNRGRGIHWHVEQDVELWHPEEHPDRIDYVRVTDRSGKVKEYVSPELLRESESSDILDEVRASPELKRMDCLSCHNRVGHEFLSPRRALDDALGEGRIDRGIPYIKQKGLELLSASYDSTDDALAAIEHLEDFYRETYPDLYKQKHAEVEAAVEQLRELYGIVASPEMQASYQNYPSYLGHRDTAGCFRCHDGGHVRLDEKERPTRETIPFSCSTCHTFPQANQTGQSVQTLTLGTPPNSHRNKRFVLDHRNVAGSTAVVTTTCVACHSQAYCSNCHTARLVHGNMLYDHAGVIRQQGVEACTACHQPSFCSRCHEGNVLEKPTERAPPKGGH